MELGSLLAGLQNGGGAANPAFKAIVDHAKLTPEQSAIFGLLMSMQEAAPPEAAVDAHPPAPPAAAPGERRPLPAMQRELADLREVNDTVAAALGACRFCWGGDADCEACSGYGHPGSRVPDAKLFSELVVPALRRARGSRAPRDRAFSPQHR